MPNAYIFNKHLNASERTTIEEVIDAAGYDVIYEIPLNASALDQNSDVGVLGLPVALEDEAGVNAVMKMFAGAGIRIVCIWLRSEDRGGIGVPEGVGKYGTTVDIGSPELIEALKGETYVWEEPGGAPSPAPTIKRNKC